MAFEIWCLILLSLEGIGANEQYILRAVSVRPVCGVPSSSLCDHVVPRCFACKCVHLVLADATRYVCFVLVLNVAQHMIRRSMFCSSFSFRAAPRYDMLALFLF